MIFFKRYGDHRDLHVLTHTFPTRRSSDLEFVANEEAKMSNVTLLRMSELTRRLGIARSTVYKMMKERGFPRPVKLTGRVVAWRVVDVVAYLEDRKSTRLNSSH